MKFSALVAAAAAGLAAAVVEPGPPMIFIATNDAQPAVHNRQVTLLANNNLALGGSKPFTGQLISTYLFNDGFVWVTQPNNIMQLNKETGTQGFAVDGAGFLTFNGNELFQACPTTGNTYQLAVGAGSSVACQGAVPLRLRTEYVGVGPCACSASGSSALGTPAPTSAAPPATTPEPPASSAAPSSFFVTAP